MADASATMGFVKLVVRDLQAQAAFYRSVCGFGEGQFVTGEIAGRPIEEIIFPGLIVLTYPGEAAPSPHGVIVGFRTPDIEAFQAGVLAAGGKVAQPIGPLTFGQTTTRLAFFTDPEGFLMEVIEG